MRHHRTLLFSLACAALFACSGDDGANTDLDDASGVDVGADTASDTGTSTDTGSSTDSDTGSSADTTVHVPDVIEDTDPSDITYIHLNGASATVEGDATYVSIDGGEISILGPGTYEVDGTLNDGLLYVESDADGTVQITLNNVDITHSDNAPIHIEQADTTVIYLAEGSTNRLEDGVSYTFPSAEEDEPNGALYSRDDLTIAGPGDLEVIANYEDGIVGKDVLILQHTGTITVTAADDGIRGKDALIMTQGTVVVTSGGDGLKATNDSDATLGYVELQGGSVTVNAGGDGIQAETALTIVGGSYDITTAGGAGASISADLSAKGLKAGEAITIYAGSFTIDAADDGVHSNVDILIQDGTFNIATADDGVHAEENLRISGGSFTVTESYEALESGYMYLSGGEFHLFASDDGINVAGGVDGSGGGRPGGPGEVGDYLLQISGGFYGVYADGDGLDANGTIEMSGGIVVVHGPTESMNGALDYDRAFPVTGGVLVAVGSNGMPEAPGETSSQAGVLVSLDSNQSAGTLVHVESADGTEIFTFEPAKAFQSIAFSSPDLSVGSSYALYLGGSHSGTSLDGYYTDGTYSAGSLNQNLSLTSTITTFGRSGGGRP